jgi:archaeal flagellin FlaB
MINPVRKFLGKIYGEQKGITGLETAIILIAFVTVAAVLAYTVLSAGIFSSERGKEAVYGGLQGAQSTMELKGTVLGTSDGTNLTDVSFHLALAIPGSKVDMDSIVINYWDTAAAGGTALTTLIQGATDDYTCDISSASVERGAVRILEGDEQFLVIVTIPGTLVAYDTFTLQIIPPTGATLTIQRTLPGGLTDVMPLN